MKQLFKYVLIFIATFAILAGSLVATVAAIPRSAIEENLQESASYLSEESGFVQIVPSKFSTQIHRYADSILLTIEYFLDSEQPLASSMWAHYYRNTNQAAAINLLLTVNGMEAANDTYLRYWHGSLVPVRILLLIGDIRLMYAVHIALLALLAAALMIMVWRHRYRAEVIGLLMALIAVNAGLVPLCLEYTWTFLIMLIASIIAVRMAWKGRFDHLGALFLITGMVTAFLDFLTTETITVLIPLLLALRVGFKEQGEDFRPWKLTIRCCALWLIGFLGMWAMKWVTASVALGENVMPYVTEHVQERLGGALDEPPSLAGYLWGAVARNIRMLFPLDFGGLPVVCLVIVQIIGIVLLVTFGCVRRREVNWPRVALYGALGLIPYIRYLALRNHSYLHYFFTYRAQMTTILALCFIVLECVEVGRSAGKTRAVHVHRRKK